MNSYTQALSTGVQILWDTLKGKRKVISYLTGGCTLKHTNNNRNFIVSKNDLSMLKVKDKKIKIKKRLVLIALLIIAVQGADTATAAKYSVDHLKLYAHSRILNYVEFQCFNKIITKESRWSYTAQNGSHFGLGQMRSKHYRDLDPYRQIDETINYITKRYQTPCNAWNFHIKHGYY
jgi:hypothetical protein